MAKRVNLIGYLNRFKKGLDCGLALYLTKSLAISVTDYCLPGYLPPPGTKGERVLSERIRLIESRLHRKAMGYRITTPICLMYAESGLLRIENRAELHAGRFWINQMKNQNKSLCKEAFKELSELRKAPPTGLRTGNKINTKPTWAEYMYFKTLTNNSLQSIEN